MVSLPALVAQSKRVPTLALSLAYSLSSLPYPRSHSTMASQQEDGPITASIRSKVCHWEVFAITVLMQPPSKYFMLITFI